MNLPLNQNVNPCSRVTQRFNRKIKKLYAKSGYRHVHPYCNCHYLPHHLAAYPSQPVFGPHYLLPPFIRQYPQYIPQYPYYMPQYPYYMPQHPQFIPYYPQFMPHYPQFITHRPQTARQQRQQTARPNANAENNNLPPVSTNLPSSTPGTSSADVVLINDIKKEIVVNKDLQSNNSTEKAFNDILIEKRQLQEMKKEIMSLKKLLAE